MLKWFPVISMLQLFIDMLLADAIPMGYGHVYPREDDYNYRGG